MNPSILLTLLYGGALAFIIYFFVQRYRPTPIVIQQMPTVYPESVWWPWSSGSYNDWPYWTGWWSGGGNGGYGYYKRRGHVGRMSSRMGSHMGGGGRIDSGMSGRMGGGMGSRIGGGRGR